MGDLCLISLGNPFCYFFGAVGYFMKINIKKNHQKILKKSKNPLNSIFEEKETSS